MPAAQAASKALWLQRLCFSTPQCLQLLSVVTGDCLTRLPPSGGVAQTQASVVSFRPGYQEVIDHSSAHSIGPSGKRGQGKEPPRLYRKQTNGNWPLLSTLMRTRRVRWGQKLPSLVDPGHKILLAIFGMLFESRTVMCTNVRDAHITGLGERRILFRRIWHSTSSIC